MFTIQRALLLALTVVATARGAIAQARPGATRPPVNEHVLGWPTADTLYLSRNVVGRSGCGDSGFYALTLSARSMQPLRVGEGVCELVGALHGAAITRDGTLAVGMRMAIDPGPVRVSLPNGAIGKLPIGCRIPAFEPHLSPDGREIAFDGMCEEGSQRVAIHTMPLDGGARRTVVSEPGYMLLGPRWSPDGRWIAYVRAPEPGAGTSGDDQVAVVAVDGSAQRVLATGRDPAWSADGGWLAYFSEDDIRVIGADGTRDRVVLRHRRRPGEASGVPGGRLAWSPDGQWIAFSRSHRNGQSVWRVNVANGTLEQLTHHPLESR